MCSASKLYKFSHVKLLCIKASESTPLKNIFIISVLLNRLKEKILEKHKLSYSRLLKRRPMSNCSNYILDTLYMPSLIQPNISDISAEYFSSKQASLFCSIKSLPLVALKHMKKLKNLKIQRIKVLRMEINSQYRMEDTLMKMSGSVRMFQRRTQNSWFFKVILLSEISL